MNVRPSDGTRRGSPSATLDCMPPTSPPRAQRVERRRSVCSTVTASRYGRYRPAAMSPGGNGRDDQPRPVHRACALIFQIDARRVSADRHQRSRSRRAAAVTTAAVEHLRTSSFSSMTNCDCPDSVTTPGPSRGAGARLGSRRARTSSRHQHDTDAPWRHRKTCDSSPGRPPPHGMHGGRRRPQLRRRSGRPQVRHWPSVQLDRVIDDVVGHVAAIRRTTRRVARRCRKRQPGHLATLGICARATS